MESMDSCLGENDIAYRRIAEFLRVNPATVTLWFHPVRPTDPGAAIELLEAYLDGFGWTKPSRRACLARGYRNAISCLREEVESPSLKKRILATSWIPDLSFWYLCVAHQDDDWQQANLHGAEVPRETMATMHVQVQKYCPERKPRPSTWLARVFAEWGVWFRLAMVILPPLLASPLSSDQQEEV